MRRAGLQIRSILGDLHLQPVFATDTPTEIGFVDLALFCTKAFSTEAAALQCKALAAANTTVLGLQNGVEAADQLGRVFGSAQVLAGATWISSSIEAPGIIRHISDSRRVVLGELDGRNSQRVNVITPKLAEAGIAAETSSNIHGVLWSKLMFIAAVAGFGSLTRLALGQYRSVPESRKLLRAMMQETAAVAAALGIRLGSDEVDNALQYLDQTRPEIRASMQLDVEAGRPSELDALIGVVVRKGRERGIPTPVTSAIYALLLPVELQAE
jgi:2-dehydropantoate 2-reductase